MGNDKKNQQQKTFEERLNQAQSKAQVDEGQDNPPPSPMGAAFQMGGELVVGVAVGGFIGYWVDKWFDTAPLFFIVLLITGFASGVRNVIRSAIRMQEVEEDDDRGR